MPAFCPKLWTRVFMLQYELRPIQQRLRRSPRLTQLLIVRIRRRPRPRPSVALLGEGFLSPAREGGREGGGNEIDRVTERVLFHLTLMAPGPPPAHRQTDRPTERPKKQATDLPFLPSFAPALRRRQRPLGADRCMTCTALTRPSGFVGYYSQ